MESLKESPKTQAEETSLILKSVKEQLEIEIIPESIRFKILVFNAHSIRDKILFALGERFKYQCLVERSFDRENSDRVTQMKIIIHDRFLYPGCIDEFLKDLEPVEICSSWVFKYSGIEDISGLKVETDLSYDDKGVFKKTIIITSLDGGEINSTVVVSSLKIGYAKAVLRSKLFNPD